MQRLQYCWNVEFSLSTRPKITEREDVAREFKAVKDLSTLLDVLFFLCRNVLWLEVKTWAIWRFCKATIQTRCRFHTVMAIRCRFHHLGLEMGVMDLHHAHLHTRWCIGQDTGPDSAPPLAMSPHVAPQTPPVVHSSSAVPDISEENFEKNVAKNKALREKTEEAEAKRTAKPQVTLPKDVTHAPRGKKILSLEPQPVLSLEPRPVLTLEPRPTLVVERRPTSQDDSALVIIRESAPHKDPILPLTLSTHVPIFESCEFRAITRRCISRRCHSTHYLNPADNANKNVAGNFEVD